MRFRLSNRYMFINVELCMFVWAHGMCLLSDKHVVVKCLSHKSS